jgi:xanthine dehydrogenase accessory factor
MTDTLFEELSTARRARTPCALITVAATRGSVPREAGSKMLVYADGKVSGTIGGGKFEALVIAEAQQQMRRKLPSLKTYPLHECAAESFGAICGGESTVLIEPQISGEAIFLIGAGHCSLAIARLGIECGLFVSVLDDRQDLLSLFPPQTMILGSVAPPTFIIDREWQSDEALVLVSRAHDIDRDALRAALNKERIGYIGMIGSSRKVKRVLDQLREDGVAEEKLTQVYAPLGLDIGADSPAEIAVSVVAEILAVLRGRGAGHLREGQRSE